jgi:glyoxylase-like metal-dependent hydrolase (beta-lactamase superfamily II)
MLVMACVFLVAYLWHHVRQGPQLSASRVPRLGQAAITIVPGIYLLGGLSPSAAYVVETSEGLLLIDSGLDSNAGRLKQQMAELGLDWRRVRAILLTHVHGDHCGGAEYLRALTRAKVYAGEGDAPVLRAGQPREAFFSTFYMPNNAPHPTQVDVALKGNEAVTVGGVRIRALATPGHTPGSICYLIERDNLRVLFAGDIIMKLLGDENPRDELGKPLGTYSAYLAPRYRGNAQDFLASLRQLRALRVPDLVLPGHPAADPVPASPCLSQERWEALLNAGIHDMEKLLARYEHDGASFLDGNPKRLLPDLYYLGNFQGAAVYGLFASSKFFVVDAPGGPGLLDFLKTRLEQLGRKPVAPTAVLLTSCDLAATAGLNDLIEKCHPEVVVARAGLEFLKGSCPAGTIVVSAEELPAKGWFQVTPTPLSGRGLAPIAYQVRWTDKTVLFSGRIPIKVNQETGVALFSDFMSSRGSAALYLTCLNQLRSLKPDLWLPAIPTDGQNANLYDSQWEQVIEENRLGIERNISFLNKNN